MKLLFDGDVINYRAGYASKGDYILAVDIVNHYILETLDRFGDKVDNDFVNYRIFLSGPKNFRYEIATLKPYKGNRDPKKRPSQYNNIREYMVDWWGAEITMNGYEADDLIGLTYDSDSIAVTIDKDIRTLPNIQYYDFVKKELYFIDEEEAWYNFYRQMLWGDASDNIPGINKIGEKKSEKLLKGKTKEEQEAIVKELYEKQYGENWQKAYDEIYKLLYILR